MIEQHTEEWLQQRLGQLTASRFADAVAETRSGWGASRDNYAAELVVERLTGMPTERYVSPAMQRGTEMEAQARDAYAFFVIGEIVEAGYVPHPIIAMSGASPDGYAGDDGLVELKCPGSAQHIRTLLGEPIANKYVLQCMWQLACTGRKWCDWVSYDDRLPPAMQLHLRRIERDDAMIVKMEKQAKEFLAEVDAKVAALKARYPMEELAA